MGTMISSGSKNETVGSLTGNSTVSTTMSLTTPCYPHRIEDREVMYNLGKQKQKPKKNDPIPPWLAPRRNRRRSG